LKQSERNRYARLLAAVGAVVALSGCATYGAANIQSSPQGAEVVNLEDDSVLGLTPVTVWWKGDSANSRYVNIRLQKPGFRDKVTAFWVNMRHSSRDDAMSEPVQVQVNLEPEGPR